jgi:hypothetical protein
VQCQNFPTASKEARAHWWRTNKASIKEREEKQLEEEEEEEEEKKKKNK